MNTTTLLSEKAGEGRTGTGLMFEKMLCKIVAKNRRRTLKDTPSEVQGEVLPYALANTLGEIKAEIILRESA